jgi:hypothetical protein
MSNFNATDEEVADFIEITLTELALMARSITITSEKLKKIEECITLFQGCAGSYHLAQGNKPILHGTAKVH